jgi:predicted amidohydrolase
MKFSAGIAQIDPKVGDLEGNLKLHLRLIDIAIEQGVNVILFPELSLTGYTVRDLIWEIALEPSTSHFLNVLREKSKSISIIIGLVEDARDYGIYNSAVFFEDGEIKHLHRKVYLPTYGMFEEGRYFSKGKQAKAFNSKYGRFGILVCEDMWHISLPYLLAIDGAEVIFALSASPTRLSGDQTKANSEVNNQHHRSYARLLSSYILFSNRIGFEDGINFWGGSAAFDPFGDMICIADSFSEQLLLIDIDSEKIKKAKRTSRHFLDEDIRMVRDSLDSIIQKQ